MKKIFDISQNSWLKIVGIIAVLYFALFSNKENPHSLGHNLNKDEISKGYKEALNKGKKIHSDVFKAQELKKRMMDPSNSTPDILVFDEVESLIGNRVSCNDIVDIAFEIKNINNDIIQPKTNMSLVVGKGSSPIIEEHLLNMRESSIKILNIPFSYQGNSQMLSSIRSQGYKNIIYRFELANIRKNNDHKYNCKL